MVSPLAVQSASKSVEAHFLADPLVSGAGHDPVSGKLIVYLSEPIPDDHLTVYEVSGVPVEYRVVGPIEAFLDQLARARPVQPGISIGHKDISAGTLGLIAFDDKGAAFAVSNNHVLAHQDSIQVPVAAVGDDILQPGKADHGADPGDVVGHLERWVKLDTANPNQVDVAAARLSAPFLTEPLGDVTPLSGNFVDPVVGMVVFKSGRTTGNTQGTIEALGVAAKVRYESGNLIFNGCFTTGAMSSPGDSGSACYDAAGNLVGLLFAGNGSMTMFIPAKAALAAVQLTLSPPPPPPPPIKVQAPSPPPAVARGAPVPLVIAGAALLALLFVRG